MPKCSQLRAGVDVLPDVGDRAVINMLVEELSIDVRSRSAVGRLNDMVMSVSFGVGVDIVAEDTWALVFPLGFIPMPTVLDDAS